MKINIKNMVCNRCISAVQNIFDNLKIPLITLELGEIVTQHDLSKNEINILDHHLTKLGFQILEDVTKMQIEKIKTLIILKINDLDIAEDFILSKFIAENLSKDYSSLSKIFSVNENMTLEQYFILQKVEKAKELLLYNEFSLTEISQKLGYRSVQHLSTQFKNTTGYTPTSFKNLKSKNRISLDKI
ncbi:helix-turn-helix transcriptional regulator [Chryseobacterium sp. SNU WT5]|uniref:helix-turn-helix domain-containing protein n=1 Tax=Chryseobacterium sp. SNU WT5 TaxID=2594269 RepID=UPI00117C789C|nr:helix-turn-helix transcriptional regulator [Chryseobacterium sp. SNU WT5]QDP86542.1 helix-turn-helix transcriptional regulator [Chryseobacterium sp. SNU WT5]